MRPHGRAGGRARAREVPQPAAPGPRAVAKAEEEGRRAGRRPAARLERLGAGRRQVPAREPPQPAAPGPQAEARAREEGRLAGGPWRGTAGKALGREAGGQAASGTSGTPEGGLRAGPGNGGAAACGLRPAGRGKGEGGRPTGRRRKAWHRRANPRGWNASWRPAAWPTPRRRRQGLLQNGGGPRHLSARAQPRTVREPKPSLPSVDPRVAGLECELGLLCQVRG